MRLCTMLGLAALSMTLVLAAACGGGEAKEAPTPVPTVAPTATPAVTLPEPSSTFSSWVVGFKPGSFDPEATSPEVLEAIRETVERHEALRHEYECSLTLDGLPMEEVATERRIADIEAYLAKQREVGLCEVVTSETVATYTGLTASEATVNLDGRFTVRYFDPATGEEAKEPEEYVGHVRLYLVKGADGRWRVDSFGKPPA